MDVGVYFDVKITNTSSVYLAIHNTEIDRVESSMGLPSPSSKLNVGHVSFHSSLSRSPAGPISLLARIDEEEYILLPNSTDLVAISIGDLSRSSPHDIRIIAPMTDDGGQGIFEFEGIWLEEGGRLLRVDGSQTEEIEYDEALDAESKDIGKEHRRGLGRLWEKSEAVKAPVAPEALGDVDEGYDSLEEKKRVLEVLTDTPGSMGHRSSITRTGGSDGLLGGVMGWEYLLGEMFSIDHVGIGVDGMCLTQHCIGGTGEPAGLGDVFFRRYDPALLRMA